MVLEKGGWRQNSRLIGIARRESGGMNAIILARVAVRSQEEQCRMAIC